MKVNELIKTGERTEEYTVTIPAEYDDEGNITVESHKEIRTRTVPATEIVYRDMTEEEIIATQECEEEPEVEEPTQLDRIEAQTMYTALMTDTLLEE